jgi:hypothetical protein
LELYHKQNGKCAISGRVLVGNAGHVNQLTFLGADPKGLGFETSDVMAEIAPKIGYEFKNDGFDALGRHINPRIEKVQAKI